MSVRTSTGSFSIWLACVVALASPALADTQIQQYSVDGRDEFRIAGHDLRSEISYSGVQRLRVRKTAGATIFEATVTYERREGTASSHATASFSSTMLGNGEVRDGNDRDPDYLTVLNQPFAVQLDAATMHDLRGLQGPVPFDFPSPMTGAVLHGSLRRLPDGVMQGRPVLGIAFSATGPLNGSLPDRADMTLGGTITMNGTAYYANTDALLMALEATLEIAGRVTNSGSNDPVNIVYRRTIRPTAR